MSLEHWMWLEAKEKMEALKSEGPFSNGKIIESELLVENGEPYEVTRTWIERLFTAPWRPFKITRTVIPKVPMRYGYYLPDGTFVCHPALAQSIKRLIANS